MTHAEKVNEGIAEGFYDNIQDGLVMTPSVKRLIANEIKDALTAKDTLYESKIKELEAEIARLNTIHSMMEDIRSGVKKGTVTIDREGFRILFAEEIGRLEAKIAVLEENQSGSLLKQFAYKSQQFIEAMDKINILEAL